MNHLFKRCLFLLFIWCLSCNHESQDRSNADDSTSLNVNSEEFLYDSLFKRIPYVNNYNDSIVIYEKRIADLIEKVVSYIQLDTVERKEEKSKLLNSLLGYKENYKKSLNSLHDIFYYSFGDIPREKGEISALFYLDRLKQDYFFLQAIKDNIEGNF